MSFSKVMQDIGFLAVLAIAFAVGGAFDKLLCLVNLG
jgi:hypothetical protein